MKKLNLMILMIFVLSNFSFSQTASVLPKGKKFYIQSAQNYGRNNEGVWDVSGKEMSKGKNLGIWKIDNGCDQTFQFTSSSQSGYYEIYPCDNSNVRVDISGGKAGKCTNIPFWDKNSSDAQKFLFHHMGDGRFKIYTTNGHIVNLKNTDSKNGNNLQTWTDHNGIHNEWFLVSVDDKKAYIPIRTTKFKIKGSVMPEDKRFVIQSAISYGRNKNGFWDLPGDGKGSVKKAAQYKIWAMNNNDFDRNFNFEKNSSGEYYKFVSSNKDLVLDVKGGKANKGDVLHLWTKHNGTSQDFYFKHLGNGRFKIYHRSGKIIALQNSNDKNGNILHLWDDHNAIQAEWYILDVFTMKPYIPVK